MQYEDWDDDVIDAVVKLSSVISTDLHIDEVKGFAMLDDFANILQEFKNELTK